jgi:phosphoribosylaminoimidazole-succinocarboxamide synthase
MLLTLIFYIIPMPMTATTIDKGYHSQIQDALGQTITQTSLAAGKKYQGKVRDTYELEDKLILITTDRQSAFDRVLASIPFKGQVLNLTSAWWFEQTEHIISNHVIAIPDPNVTVAKKCEVFPVEFVMRGYVTGTTGTSIWTQYKNGVRNYCGNVLPEGLVKNQRLAEPLLTPTTKDALHDRPISAEDIVKEGLMTQADWDTCATAARKLFQFGVETAAKHGLILVDTKYEMGKDADGNIVIVDEMHTPDSSRYWLSHSYAERFADGKEPENIDKEFLRLWFIDHCDPYNDIDLPRAPEELIVTLSSRYIQLYEMITGNKFHFPMAEGNVEKRIQRNLAAYLA